MSETEEFTIGTEVACSDGVCGDLSRVVVDPVARALTHLVVKPVHGPGEPRLVPIDLVESNAKAIQLRCSRKEFEGLDDAQETQFLPGGRGPWKYGQEQMLSWPYFLGGGMGGGGLANLSPGPELITTDRVPAGEVDVRRGDDVHAKDGTIGRVQGLVVDPRDHHVTHVLLDEGHLWGQKRVAIPIGSVANVDDGVRLTLTKDQVRDLPPVDIDAP
ncbi:MAG: PRC-barrel domain-containing protein [Candidatus Dormibacteraceae bacterium]